MNGLVAIRGGDRMVALEDRYLLREGAVFLSGVQALVRLLLDQHRVDACAGLRTATLVSGYQGSPLAGFDKELARLGSLAAEHELVLRPAVNEELGATAVWGSQLAGTLPGPRYDGVLGVWYGKSPGVDRAADAIRHGNYVGTDPRGGVLALCGDDPSCKSSTIPSASEALLAALQVPVFAPGSVQEVLDLGRHAIACSRASGLWAAVKLVTNVADAVGTVEVGLDRVTPAVPVFEWEGAPYVHRPSAHLLAPQSLEMERTLVEVRLKLAKLYARINGLNTVVRDGPGARLGVIASGATAHDLLQALIDLGLEDVAPIRVLKVDMLYPLDEEAVRRFARGLEEVFVVEERGPFLEQLVRDALYGLFSAPLVTGKRDDWGQPLLPSHGTLDSDAISRALGSRLLIRDELSSVRTRLDKLNAVATREVINLGAQRTPFFCSGCPHNTSLVAPDGAIVGAGIGCHTMVMFSPKGHGSVTGITQMGGEGAQWIGAAPFVTPAHFVQNLGDGTFHHSGSLAIRAAVAAHLNVTYKILYNDTVAMTGGQHVEGQLTVAALARVLALEGVRRIVVTSDDNASYSGSDLPPNCQLRDRDDMLAVQLELAKIEGVTVLIHDQACAAELRRARKRGRAPEPRQTVLINERVCEGCGDCGEKSGCLSVEPIETDFGRKTRIHQDSCNKDFSCLEGDCPSFLTILAPRSSAGRRPAPLLPGLELPERQPLCAGGDVRIRLVGIGGTGVVTAGQVLGMAALLDGRHASGLDQTGLSQKAGSVVSDVRITTAAAEGGVTVPSASVDVLLGLDLLGAASPSNLRVADPKRTLAIVSTSATPTGAMVVDVNAPALSAAAARSAIDGVTRAAENVYLDAQLIAERILGDSAPTNVIVLGAAWQCGALPVSLGALHEAFRVNGVAVELNLAALAWGRACVVAPDLIAAALDDHPAAAEHSPQARTLVDCIPDGMSRRLLELHVAELLQWGGEKAAARYVEAIARVRVIEQEQLGDTTALSEAVARGLYKLIAYKDEYEVARLHINGLATLPPGTKAVLHLHPPMLRALGLKHKLKLGRWFVPVLRLLRHGRILRGTPLDPFGHARVRRVERALPAEYLSLVDLALARLRPATLQLALEVAALPEFVRGYEQIKLAGVERFRVRARELQLLLTDRTEEA